MKAINNLKYIHELLDKEDDYSLLERILDDIHDNKRLNSGEDKHVVYYLQVCDDEKSGEKDFWVNNIRRLCHLYVYAMLFNWNEQWPEDVKLKERLESIQSSFSNEIATEIKLFEDNKSEEDPSAILWEVKFITDVLQWKCKKEVPQFTEEQTLYLLSNPQKQERYLYLLNNENLDTVIKNLENYLRFCIVIDNMQGDTKCLTSFVKRLYGKEDTINFNEMLKNISLDHSEAKVLRLFVKEGDAAVPLDLIKLVIYSNINAKRQEDGEDVGENDLAIVIFHKAIEDFEILKDNLTRFEQIDQLRLASFIRDKIVNNEYIGKLCSADATMTAIRTKLLDDIKDLHLSILTDVLSVPHEINVTTDSAVKNFKQAKNGLLSMAVSERDAYSSINKENHPLIANDQLFLTHFERLSTIIDNCSNDSYRVLIMGEYESGKSTLTDAIIGRHIGAIGDGNTTSAVPIELSYGDKLNVNILLKSKNDIMSLFSDIKKYIDNFLPDHFDIENKEERNKLYKKLNAFRRHNDCPKVKEPGFKKLAICSLILKFYNDSRLQQLTQDFEDVTHISMISRFPNGFESRWHKRGGDDFTFEESVFAFVERVCCYLPSEALKKLNCTFIDSPGLFSNAYDTQVTVTEMINANAILYLLPYDKEVGEDTCTSLYILKKKYPNILRKLFIVNNRSFCDHKRFYQANVENIKEMFGTLMDLHKVDARLAYLGVIRESYDKGKLSDDEKSLFVQLCQYGAEEEDDMEFDDFVDAWEYCLYPYRRRYSWINSPSAQEVIEKSKLPSILENLFEFIEKNKAYSIIFSEGVIKLYNELTSIIKNLEIRYVEPYSLDREKLEKKWSKRISVASDFEQSAKLIINKHLFETYEGRSSLVDRLTDSTYFNMFTNDAIDQMIIGICRVIYNNKWKLSKCGKNESKIKEFISPKIENVVSDYIVKNVNKWNDFLHMGQNMSFTTTFSSQIMLLENDLDTTWKNLFIDDNEFHNARNIYFDVSKDPTTFSIGSSQDSGKGLTVDRVPLTGALINDIATITSAILLLLMPTIMALIITLASNPLGWVIGGIAISFGAATYFFTGDSIVERNFVNHYAPKIKQEITEQKLETKLKDFIHKEITDMMEAYASGLHLDIKHMHNDRDIALSSPEEEVEQNCFEAIKEIVGFKKQISKYSEFCKQYIPNEQN